MERLRALATGHAPRSNPDIDNLTAQVSSSLVFAVNFFSFFFFLFLFVVLGFFLPLAMLPKMKAAPGQCRYCPVAFNAGRVSTALSFFLFFPHVNHVRAQARKEAEEQAAKEVCFFFSFFLSLVFFLVLR